jgi:uncharacterized protein
MNTGRISEKDIRYSIINLPQLVFEVTDDCNLNCYYCAYGDLYYGYDKREARYMKFSDAKLIIDYLAEFWRNYTTDAETPLTYFGFYGGEPLLNMSFIIEVVEYVESLNLPRTIEYSMTTNAILLDRYMYFLAEKHFHLLISLDGDKDSHGYRVDKGGHNSFDRVISNVRTLKEKYPTYFINNVNFNSVLHNKNSVEGIFNFINNEFGKSPQVSELNNTGIKKDKIEQFNRAYQSKRKSLQESQNNKSLYDKGFLNDPYVYNAMIYIQNYSQNVYKYYDDLFIDPNKINYTPTGTCIPFSRKMFVTVNGKILQCEKIHQNFTLGKVAGNTIELDLKKIAEKQNRYLDKMQQICSLCYNKLSCLQCLFNVDNIEIESSKPICSSFMRKQEFNKYQYNCLKYIKEHHGLYRELVTKMLDD